MILTITLNPSVDISYPLDTLKLDDVNRIQNVSKTAGGKGLNVSRVLQQLQADVAASGFLGGSLGDFIRKQLESAGIQDFFTSITGETRNCIAVIHDGKQTEILEGGPNISEQEAQRFLEQFSSQIDQVEMATISGSLPKGLPDDFYQNILEIADRHEKPVLLDTKGELLKKTLEGEHKPFLIKPNEDELADLTEQSLDSETQIIDGLKNALFANVPHVVVTLGSQGAVVKQHERIYLASIPSVQAVNPVGSGDSVVAGFAAGLSRGLTGKEWIQFGLAMGVLNAMEKKTGQIDPYNIEWCMKQIEVTQIA